MKRIFLLSTVILIVCAALAYAAPVGKITHIEGRVDVMKAGRSTAQPVTLGAPVDVGDIYRAKTASKAEITFTNKNLLRIAPGSRLEIKEYMVQGERSSSIVRLHRGRVQAVAGEELVRKVAAFAEGNKFEVHTQNAVAGIRGTNMLVGFERGISIVIFLSGKGYLFNPAAPNVIVPITAGNMSVISADNALPSGPRPAADAQIKSFIQAVTPTVTSQASTGSAPAATPPAGADTGASLAIFTAPAPTTTGSQASPTNTTLTTVQQLQQQQLQQILQQQQQQGQVGTTSQQQVTGPLSGDALVSWLQALPSQQAPSPTDQVPVVGNVTGQFFDQGSASSSGSVTGVFGASSLGSAMVGTFLNPGTTLWTATMTGDTASGGAFQGLAGGTWTSWAGPFAAISVENGILGFIRGNLSGTTAPPDGFLGVGSLFYESLGSTTLTAQQIKNLPIYEGTAQQSSTPFYLGGPTEIAFSDGRLGPMSKVDFMMTPQQQGGKVYGIVRELAWGGSYYNPYPNSTATGVFGQIGQNQYTLGPFSFTDDSANKRFGYNVNYTTLGTSTLTTQYMSYEGHYLSDDLYNPYQHYDFRMGGAGTVAETPLAYGGSVMANTNLGEMSGLLGGLSDVFSGGQVPLYMMGSLLSTPPDMAPTSFGGGFSGNRIGGGGAFMGFVAGAYDKMKALGLYISGTSTYAAGYLYGGADVVYYPALEMWKADGTIRSASIQSTTRSPDSLMSHITGGSLGGGVQAAFTGNTGSLSATNLSGSLLGIDDQSWGIWNMTVSGSYSPTTGRTLSGKAGGQVELGSSGYWLADIQSSDWGAAANRLETPRPNQVDPAVAHMGDGQPPVVDDDGRHRRPHPLPGRVPLGSLVNGLVGEAYGRGKPIGGL